MAWYVWKAGNTTHSWHTPGCILSFYMEINPLPDWLSVRSTCASSTRWSHTRVIGLNPSFPCHSHKEDCQIHYTSVCDMSSPHHSTATTKAGVTTTRTCDTWNCVLEVWGRLCRTSSCQIWHGSQASDCESIHLCVSISLSVKAVHLEATSAAFVDTLLRFIARRGYSSMIWSDNGTTFVGAIGELKGLYDFSVNSNLNSCLRFLLFL